MWEFVSKKGLTNWTCWDGKNYVLTQNLTCFCWIRPLVFTEYLQAVVKTTFLKQFAHVCLRVFVQGLRPSMDDAKLIPKSPQGWIKPPKTCSFFGHVAFSLKSLWEKWLLNVSRESSSIFTSSMFFDNFQYIFVLLVTSGQNKNEVCLMGGLTLCHLPHRLLQCHAWKSQWKLQDLEVALWVWP